VIHVAHFIAISCYAAARGAAGRARGDRAFSLALMNKFLHEPTVRLRAASGDGVRLEIIDAARYPFALDEKTTEGPPNALTTAGDRLTEVDQ
jgi:hypothetical protein